MDKVPRTCGSTPPLNRNVRQLRYGAQVTTSLYDSIGGHYRDYRRPDQRIAAVLSRGLAGARAIVNIGAGVGSYEPRDRNVVAVEPSWVMISQRVGAHILSFKLVQRRSLSRRHLPIARRPADDSSLV